MTHAWCLEARLLERVGVRGLTVDKVQHVNAPALAEVAGPVASDSQECW